MEAGADGNDSGDPPIFTVTRPLPAVILVTNHDGRWRFYFFIIIYSCIYALINGLGPLFIVL